MLAPYPAGGHAGYEIAPFIPSVESLASLLLGGCRPASALNTVRHHDMHHRYPPYHFSLYMWVAHGHSPGGASSGQGSYSSALLAGWLAAGGLHGARPGAEHWRRDPSFACPRRTHWDRWCGTEHPRYRADVAKHFPEPAASGKAAAAAAAAASPEPSTPLQVKRIALRGSPPGHAARAIVG